MEVMIHVSRLYCPDCKKEVPKTYLMSKENISSRHTCPMCKKNHVVSLSMDKS